MKLAVSGKGGVGKTTLVAILSRLIAADGHQVIAIDGDPASNLAAALGLPAAVRPAPIREMKELIQERTGASPGSSGQYFKLNPDVADFPEKFSVAHEGVRLMVLGGITKGGGGCACPENALLKTLLAHLLVMREDAVIVDMEAGIEHLGRATVAAVDALIVVVEPGPAQHRSRRRDSPPRAGDRDPENAGRRKQSPDGRASPVPRRSRWTACRCWAAFRIIRNWRARTSTDGRFSRARRRPWRRRGRFIAAC